MDAMGQGIEQGGMGATSGMNLNIPRGPRGGPEGPGGVMGAASVGLQRSLL